MKSTQMTQIIQHPEQTMTWRQAHIDLDAIAANVRWLKQQADVEEFIAVVKADGYGHGAAQVAQAAVTGGATRIGVADVEEAKELVNAGVVEVPVLAWLHRPEEDFIRALTLGIEIGVTRLAHLEAVAAASPPDHPGAIHIKVETGLGRGGAAPQEWDALFKLASTYEANGLIRVVGIFSHLSGTSEEDDLAQLRLFGRAIRQAETYGLDVPIRHIAATAATISLPAARLNAVRVGLGIYGMSPFENRSSIELGLRPAMTLQSQVVAVRNVLSGQGVSYGYDYKADEPTRLVLVPLGYADGIPRQASGNCAVSIKDTSYPVVGRIAMDQFVVNVGQDLVEVGDSVTVFGAAPHAPSIDDWAEAADTINYMIAAGIGRRVTRSYHGGSCREKLTI